MKYLHTMVRVLDLEKALWFYCEVLGLQEQRRREHQSGRFTLVFLGTPEQDGFLELTWNWDQTVMYDEGRNFGHIAFAVEDIYATCTRLEAAGIVINRPPRDGRMAFVRSPDGISIELLQEGEARKPQEPWVSQPNQGYW